MKFITTKSISFGSAIPQDGIGVGWSGNLTWIRSTGSQLLICLNNEYSEILNHIFSPQDAGDRIICHQTETGQEDHTRARGKDHQNSGDNSLY